MTALLGMSTLTLVVVVLIVLALVSVPVGTRYGWSPAYGGGALGAIVLVLLVLFLLGHRL